MKYQEKIYDFSPEKNRILIEERNISFEEVTSAIVEGFVLDILPHPNQSKYPNQQIYVLNISDYVYLVPFVEKEEVVFLKTIFPHRKLTKQYILNTHQFSVFCRGESCTRPPI